MSETRTGPMLRRRRAGARLRALREAAGKPVEEVADYLECSAAKISRIETGRVPPRLPDVRQMLDLYGVGGAEREEILALVRESRQPVWWQDYTEVIPPGYDIFLGLRDAAAVIDTYQPYLMPGLLQTRDYAAAVLTFRGDIPDQHARRMIELRVASREHVLDHPNPPEARFYIEEAVIHRPVGGPSVLRDQLAQVADYARRDHISIQVIPTAAGLTGPLGTQFVLLSYPDPDEPRTVYIEQFWGSRNETHPDQIRRYQWALDNLRATALNPEESLALITDAANRLGGTPPAGCRATPGDPDGSPASHGLTG